jgi:hypothetical protein
MVLVERRLGAQRGIQARGTRQAFFLCLASRQKAAAGVFGGGEVQAGDRGIPRSQRVRGGEGGAVEHLERRVVCAWGIAQLCQQRRTPVGLVADGAGAGAVKAATNRDDVDVGQRIGAAL